MQLKNYKVIKAIKFKIKTPKLYIKICREIKHVIYQNIIIYIPLFKILYILIIYILRKKKHIDIKFREKK